MLQWFVFIVLLFSTRGVCMSRSFCHGNGKRQVLLCLRTYFNDTGQQIPTGLNAILGIHTETSRSSVDDPSAGIFTPVPSTTEHGYQHELSRTTNTVSFTQVPRSSAAYPANETTSTDSTSGFKEIVRWTMVIQTDHTAEERVQSRRGGGRTGQGQTDVFNKRWCGPFMKFTNCLEEAVGHCPSSLVSACRTVASFRTVYGRTICKIDTAAWRNKDASSCRIVDDRNNQSRVLPTRVLLTLAFLNIWWIVFFSEDSTM